MTRLDWKKAQGGVAGPSTAEIPGSAARQDREVLEEADDRRRKALKKLRKASKKLPANWLKTPEDVARYKSERLRENKD